MELLQLNELRQVLEQMAEDLAQGYKDEIERNGHNASMALYNSVTSRVEYDGRFFDVILNLEDYWKYIENGTRPHFPPFEAILKWVQVKPVIPSPRENGTIPTETQLARAIQYSIGMHGTKGTHSLDKTKDGIIPFYRERIEEALGHDMYDYISKLLP